MTRYLSLVVVVLLAVLFAHEVESDGAVVGMTRSSDDSDDDNDTTPWHRRRNVRLYGGLALLATCTVGATIAVLVAPSSSSSTPSSSPPSPSDTPPPSQQEEHPREGLGIRELIQQVVGQDNLMALTSPYRQALEWIIHDDPAQLVPGTAVNFVQRSMF